MKKAIITKRIVSIFLSSITAFMLPSQAFATNLSDKNIKYSSFDDIQGNGEKVANIVMELEISKRNKIITRILFPEKSV